jgi:hypothetical protein
VCLHIHLRESSHMKKTLLALGVLLASSANAELVNGDWQTVDDNQITIDTDTGIEWLKLGNTANMSINDVIAETQEGGDFAGWRLPTSQEVQTILDTVLPQFTWNDDTTETTFSSGSYRGATDTWRSFFGSSRYQLIGNGSNNNRYWHSFGLHVEDNGDVLMTGTYRRQKYGWGNYEHWASFFDDHENADGYTTDYSSADYGVFLVSDGGLTLASINDPTLNDANPNSPSNVSLPGGVIAIAMTGLLGFRRKNKKT